MHGLFLQKDLPYLAGKICPSCGKIMPFDENVCPHCSFNLIKANETSEASVQRNNYSSHFMEEKGKNLNLYCECCGSKLLPGQIYCSNCGAKTKKKICSNCHNLIDISDSICPFCNEKQFDNNFTIAKEEKNSFDLANTSLDKVNNAINNDTNNKVEEKVEDNTTVIDTDNIKTESIFLQDTKTIVKLKRKRIMLFLQLLVIGLIATCLLFIPIYVKGSLFAYIPSMFKEYKNTTLVKGLDLVECLLNQDFKALTSLKVTNLETNHILFSMSSEYVASILICITYAIISIKLIFDFIVTLISMINKKPFITWLSGSTTIILFIFASILYIFIPLGAFKGYETFFLYIFIINFFFWFICKLLFSKEAKMYKISAINKKMLK